MKKSNILFVGLDVHKESISVAIAESDRGADVRHYGTIGGDIDSFAKLVRKLQSTGATLCFVYEAGPCGYEIYRYLKSRHLDCAVVAPSMIPKRAGNRIKNDRRDAMELARLHRAGDLSSVYVPDREHEAIRDLVRAREDAKNAERKARQQLKALLLRNGIRYEGKASWTHAHLRWLSEFKMPLPAQQVVFQEYVDAITTNTARVDRLTEEIARHVQTWRMYPVIQALQALRGVQLVVAATIVAELGDVTRFDNPRQLMAFLGLIPKEHSSGEKVHRGSITKTGNTHVRRVLVEASWHYRMQPRVSRTIRVRHECVSPKIIDISWRAQLRLSHKFRILVARGKLRTVAVTAVARELVGFIWAIAKEVPISA